MDDDYMFLVEQAQKCRVLAERISDRQVRLSLTEMAEAYELRAKRLVETLPTKPLSP